MEIIKSVPKNIQASKDLSHQIPWSTACLTPPWTPSGAVGGQQVEPRGAQSPRRRGADASAGQLLAALLVSASLQLAPPSHDE